MTAGGAGGRPVQSKKKKNNHHQAAPQAENKPSDVEVPPSSHGSLELEVESPDDAEDRQDHLTSNDGALYPRHHHPYSDDAHSPTTTAKTNPPPLPATASASKTEMVWLFICFFGIMASFVCYGLLLEYTTSGGRQLHELSFLFVTSGLYTLTAAAGRYVRDETPTTIPPARFAVLGLTSMGSTFCSVRSLRYVGGLGASSTLGWLVFSLTV